MPDTKVEIISSGKLISPSIWSIFFSLHHPLIPNQPFAWVLVELSWSEPTLIEPFLDDVRSYLQEEIISLKVIDDAHLLQLYKKIKERFIDWKLAVVLLFRQGNSGFKVFSCGDRRAYLVVNGQIKELPLTPNCRSFFYLPKSTVSVLVTTNILPPNLQVSDLRLLSQELKKQGRGFILLTPSKKDKLSWVEVRSFLKKIYLPLGLGLVFILSISFAYYFSLYHSSRGTPLILENKQTQSPQLSEENLFHQIEVIKDSDPQRAGLLLQKLKTIARDKQVTSLSFWQRVHQLEAQLNGESKNALSLVFDNHPFFPSGGRVVDDTLFLFNEEKVVKLSPKRDSALQLVFSSSTNKLVDVVVTGPQQFYYLTSKGIFRWQGGKEQQLQKLPQNVLPTKLAVYRDNIYLLTRQGEVYKYRGGQENYPVEPTLYFFDPQLKEVKEMIVNKRFYFLTPGGQLLVYYFGKRQTFSFSQPITPLIDIYWRSDEKKFYFLNPQGWGSFDQIGQVSDYHQQKNSGRFIFPFSDKIGLLADDQLLIINRQ